MPRKLRMFVEGGVYHVYCRVSRGDGVFLDESEAESFLEIVRNVPAAELTRGLEKGQDRPDRG